MRDVVSAKAPCRTKPVTHRDVHRGAAGALRPRERFNARGRTGTGTDARHDAGPRPGCAACTVSDYIDGRQNHVDPGQTVVPHGPNRELSIA